MIEYVEAPVDHVKIVSMFISTHIAHAYIARGAHFKGFYVGILSIIVNLTSGNVG